MTDARSVVQKHIDAFNARDAAADPWAPDAELVAPVGTFTGRDAVLGFLALFQEAFPDGRQTVKVLLIDKGAAAAEGVFAGKHDGPLRSPEGDVPPTGRPVEFRWAPFYEVRGDELASEHLFFDQADFLGQLGLLRG
jgi:predicted ester cyclase